MKYIGKLLLDLVILVLCGGIILLLVVHFVGDDIISFLGG